VGPNNLDQCIPSMDIILLVAKICHTTSFADFSSNYGQGTQYLEPGNGLKQAIQLFTHYTTCLMRKTRTASLQAITFLTIDQSQNPLAIKGGNGLKEVSYLPSETNVRLGAGGVKTKSSRAFKMGPS